MVEIFAVFGLFILIVVSKSGGVPANQLIDIGAFMVVAYKLIPGIVKISNITAQIKTYEFALKDMEHKIPPAQGKKQTNEKISSITFTDVAFTYNNNSRFHSLNFDIKAGQFIGISGDSGKGKTTTINLLMGFLDPLHGTISYNNHVTGAAGRQQYWNDIAYVKQQAFLINETILKNITFDEINYDNAMLQQALFISGLDIVLKKIPGGLNATISDNGKNISGGQRQRIAIARAIYKNAGLIILDEPFNELDNASEQIFIEHIKEYCRQGKIVVLITHNTKSLSSCDKIIII
jgi:ABC-type bacteriocin/lantibiotic exporter with double-glycine peptidase domain